MVAKHEQYGGKTLPEMPWMSNGNSYCSCKDNDHANKAWMDLAVDLMSPLLTGESFLATVDNYLVSHEMEEFLDELGIKHKKTIPLWPRAHGEVELQNKSSLKVMCAAQAEEIPWQQELQKYLLAYRLTPHTPTGISPAELLNGRKIQTKMPEFEGD